jgi:hypothetical protein
MFLHVMTVKQKQVWEMRPECAARVISFDYIRKVYRDLRQNSKRRHAETNISKRNDAKGRLIWEELGR